MLHGWHHSAFPLFNQGVFCSDWVPSIFDLLAFCLQDQESDAAKAFLEVASTKDDVPFGITSEQTLFDGNKVEKDSVVLFKNFDEKRNDLSEGITVESVTEFVAANQLPLLIEFSQDVSSVYR